jgi:hypothetical protein
MRKGDILTCSRYEYSSDRGPIRTHILPITELSALPHPRIPMSTSHSLQEYYQTKTIFIQSNWSIV